MDWLVEASVSEKAAVSILGAEDNPKITSSSVFLPKLVCGPL
jgi:hypothetical protein